MTRCSNSVGVLLVQTGEERSGYVLRMGVLRTGMGLGMGLGTGLGTRTGTGMGFGTGLGMGFCKDGEERGGRHRVLNALTELRRIASGSRGLLCCNVNVPGMA